jgi:hypothetical protein
MKVPAIVAAVIAAHLGSDGVWAQTTRTSPSAASTYKSLPASSSTSPNSPCDPNNQTSPCFSANAPRAPCYSALSPNEPCSTTTTPPPYSAPQTSTQAPTGSQSSAGGAITMDQAKSRIEEAGYSSVSGLRKEPKGAWRANAVKDGQPMTVTLDANGTVVAK